MLSIRRSPLRGFWNACSDYVAPKTWDLTVQTTDVDQTFTVDINAGVNPNVNVDWADGTVETFTTTGQKTHTYSSAGIYKIRIGASFTSGGNIRFGSNAENKHRLKKTSIIPFIKGLTNFSSTFQGCTGLTGSLPADLFRYNTLVSTYGFNYTFNGRSGLTGSLPADLFRYNTLVSESGFCATFAGCTGISLSPNIFGPPEEYATRFLNTPSNFTNCFYNTGTLAAKGTAPALWLYNYGTETPVKTGCFYGQTTNTVTNFADIPADWK